MVQFVAFGVAAFAVLGAVLALRGAGALRRERAALHQQVAALELQLQRASSQNRQTQIVELGARLQTSLPHLSEVATSLTAAGGHADDAHTVSQEINDAIQHTLQTVKEMTRAVGAIR